MYYQFCWSIPTSLSLIWHCLNPHRIASEQDAMRSRKLAAAMTQIDPVPLRIEISRGLDLAAACAVLEVLGEATIAIV